MSLVDQFIQFAEAGNQQRFSLNDGRVLQGWIMEIDEGYLVMSTGAGEQGKDVRVLFSEINLSTLAYWDINSQGWLSFVMSV